MNSSDYRSRAETRVKRSVWTTSDSKLNFYFSIFVQICRSRLCLLREGKLFASLRNMTFFVINAKNILCYKKFLLSSFTVQQIFSTTAKKPASADYLLHFLIHTLRMSWSVTSVGHFKQVRKASC